jgi:DNA-binding transcriptional regulator GbsR (MarR family)
MRPMPVNYFVTTKPFYGNKNTFYPEDKEKKVKEKVEGTKSKDEAEHAKKERQIKGKNESTKMNKLHIRTMSLDCNP